jgi:DNA-binding NtrC family response regulator
MSLIHECLLSFTSQTIGPSVALQFDMANARVLVVDDMRQMGESIAEYLELQGYAVEVATELEEAVAMLVHCGYAAVITDLNLTSLPGAEGLDIIAHVHERCPDTRIVAITGYSSMELLDEAKRRGADQVLQKPLSLRDLALQLGELGVHA